MLTTNSMRRFMTIVENNISRHDPRSRAETMVETLDPSSPTLDFKAARAIAWWFRGFFMRPHDPADLEATIKAFEQVAGLHHYDGPGRLWRVIPRAVTTGASIIPATKRLQSWSETDYGARMFFGAEIAGREEGKGPWTVIEAAIDPSWVVFSPGHLTAALDHLEREHDATDDPSLGRAWETLESAATPHTYQREVIVLFPTLMPVKVLNALPLREA